MQYMGMIELFASKVLFWSGLKHQYEHICPEVLWKRSFKNYQRCQSNLDEIMNWNEQEDDTETI